MRHPPISPARHAQGLAAYRSGKSLKELIGLVAEIDAMHTPEMTNEEHDEIQAAEPSVICGFADGFLEDIRTLANQRRGQRA
jgi:hypothetical protein